MTNIWFEVHPKHLLIRKKWGGHIKIQTDHLRISQNFKNAILQTKVFLSVKQEHDHFLVKCRLRIKLWKFKSLNATHNLQYKFIDKKMYADVVKYK